MRHTTLYISCKGGHEALNSLSVLEGMYVRQAALIRPSKSRRKRNFAAVAVHSIGSNGKDGDDEYSFDTIFKCLLTYKQKYNSTVISESFKIEKQDEWSEECVGIPLGRILQSIKRKGLFIIGNKEHKAMLKKLGYITRSEDDNRRKAAAVALKQKKDFEKLVNGLKFYKQLYSNFNVPYRYKIPSSAPFPMDCWGFNLGVAVHSLRSANKYLNIEDSEEKLQSIGYFKNDTNDLNDEAEEVEDMQERSPPVSDEFESMIDWMNQEELSEYLSNIELGVQPLLNKTHESIPIKPTKQPTVVVDIQSMLLSRRNSFKLTKTPTRIDKEKGYHYEFDIWRFEDVLRAMHFYNQLHLGDLEEASDVRLISQRLKGVGFNAINESWTIPDDITWPKKWAHMPLGKYLYEFRIGDIDAKEHWERRPLLDNIGFDWGDGYSYLSFTWKKLFQGLVWWIYFRGHPFDQLSTESIIPLDAMVADFAKPEEIQGLRLGYLLEKAWSQEPVLWHHFPNRYEFLRGLGLTWLPADALVLQYKLKSNFSIPKLPKELMSDECD